MCGWSSCVERLQAIDTQIYVLLLYMFSWVRDFEYLLRVLVFKSYTFAFYFVKMKLSEHPLHVCRGPRDEERESSLVLMIMWFIYLFFLIAIVEVSLSVNNRCSHASSAEQIFTLSRTWASGSWTCYKIVFFLYWMGREMKEIVKLYYGIVET